MKIVGTTVTSDQLSRRSVKYGQIKVRWESIISFPKESIPIKVTLTEVYKVTDNREQYYNKPRIKNILMYAKQNVGFLYFMSRWKIDHKIPIYISKKLQE